MRTLGLSSFESGYSWCCRISLSAHLRENLGLHPSGWIWIWIGVAEMLNEVLSRLCQFCIYELFRLCKGVGIIETWRVGHPEQVTRLTACYVNNGTTDSYLYLLNLIEHQQSQMSIKAVHVQGLIERGTRLENMIFLRCCQKRIKISAESVIADMAKIILGSFCILYEKATGLQQWCQLCWWRIWFRISCHNKIKRPADLSIVERLGKDGVLSGLWARAWSSGIFIHSPTPTRLLSFLPHWCTFPRMWNYWRTQLWLCLVH